MQKQERSILPERAWWGWLSLILLLAIALYYPHYDFSLPYVDHPDEPQFALAAQAVQDLGTAKSLGYHGYPPGNISLTFALLQFAHDGTGLPHEVIGLSRLISITAGWLLIIPLALLAYHSFGKLAGLLAALLWVANPTIVAQVRYALPNNYLSLFSLTALLLAYLAFKHNRNGLGILGVYSLMLAIAFKTQAIFLLPLVLGFPLLRVFTEPASERRHILANFGFNSVRMGVFLIWLLIFYPTFAANDVPHWVAPTNDIGLPTWNVLVAHWQVVIDAIETVIPIVIWAVVLILGAFWQSLRREFDILLIAFLSLSILAWWIGISLFGRQSLRQFYTMIALVTIFQAGALCIAYRFLQAGLQALSANWASVTIPVARVAGVLVAILLSINLFPQMERNIAFIQSLDGTDTRVLLASYADSSLAAGGHIATWENHKTLNPAWSGVALEQSFPFIEQAFITERSIEEWRASEVQYAVMPTQLWDDVSATYASEVTELRRFVPQADQRGSSMVVLYLYPLQVLLDDADSAIGNIDIVGYDVQQTADRLDVRLYWQADTPTSVPHHVFVHLVNSEGEIIAQHDAPPLISERRDTTHWTDPDEILMSRIYSLPIPDNLDEDDTYRVITGFYRPDTFERLTHPTTNADFVEVMPFTP